MILKNNIEAIKTAICQGQHPPEPEPGLFEPASVMLLFIPGNQLKLLFIQKADREGYPWANQMAFPGGNKEKEDANSQETALRELHEELGVFRQAIEMIGSLGHFPTINKKNVQAFACVWENKEPVVCDPLEISCVFYIPFDYLVQVHIDKKFHQYRPDVKELVYPYKEVRIWGVTARIVHHLINLLIKS